MPSVPGSPKSSQYRWGAVWPDPQLPWAERRLVLLRDLVLREEGGTGEGIDYAPKGRTRLHKSREITRLIEEGLAVLTHKTRRAQPRWSGGGRQTKRLEATPAGKALVAVPPAPRVAEPYAKRRAGLQALAAAQDE